MSYEALHKYLLPNHSINDVLIDITKITRDEVKRDEVKPESEHLPRKQRRLQERTQAKLTDKDKREKQRKVEMTQNFKKSLNQIKETVRTENLDKARIERIIFGMK